MPAKLRIVHENLHDVAELSASPAAAALFEETNTQNSLRDRTFRSTGTASQVIKGVLPAADAASCLALFRHNAHGGQVQLELFSDAAWTDSVYDSGVLEANCFEPDGDFPLTRLRPMPFVHWFEPEEFRSYAITFDGTPSGAFWEVSRVVLGLAWEAQINPDYGAPLGWGDNTESNRTLGGSHRTNRGAQWRTLQLELNQVRESDRDALIAITEAMGMGQDGLLSLFPEDGTTREGTYTLNFKFTSLDPLGRQISRLTKRLSIQEQ